MKLTPKRKRPQHNPGLKSKYVVANSGRPKRCAKRNIELER